MEDAKMAGLANKNNWKTYPRAMLLARATSELCRIVFPDIIAGLSYTPEEVSSIEGVEYFPETMKTEEPAAVVEEVEIVDAEIVEEPAPAPKRQKVGQKAEFVELADVIDKVIPTSPVENTSPPFEFRLRQVESWGGWPYVKAIAKVAAKKIGVEEPISAYELAHSEKLYKEVKMAINSKK
jgi:preprotein translocase subunit SecD